MDRSSIQLQLLQGAYVSPNERTAEASSGAALVEGNSVRAVVRMTGVAKGTVLRLLHDLGHACAEHHGKTVPESKTERVQPDETWCFVGAKERNIPANKVTECWGDAVHDVFGSPDPKHISTSYVARQKSQGRESQGCRSASLRLLQLLPRASDIARYACDGCGVHDSRVGH